MKQKSEKARGVRSVVVAVSGGVDSVVLLDMMMHEKTPETKLIVAHFDHGIRWDSADDAQFVKELAAKYGLAYETAREELGPKASEETARIRRYAFLRSVAQKYGASIATAHHADDLIETIAINLTRGTGWRGLAVLDSPDIERPLLTYTKSDILRYAKEHQIEWREDATNQDDKYLRNKLRRKLSLLDDETHRLLQLYRNRQVFLRKLIDNEAARLSEASPYSRYLFTHVPEIVAMELLRSVLVRETGQSCERPVLKRLLHAIKVLHAGKRFDVSAGVSIRFTKTHFIVEVSE